MKTGTGRTRSDNSWHEPRPIKVIHLSSAHDADDARIFWKECMSLAVAGYDVGFVLPDPYPSRRAGTTPGVAVITVPPRRTRLGRLMISPISVLLAGLRCKADVYHLHDPELLPAGMLLELLGKPVIYDVHEDVPRDLLMKPWIPRPARGLVAWIADRVEWLATTALSGFVAATPVIARRFPADRTVLVQNFARTAEFTPAANSPVDGAPVIAYLGGITVERCAIEMVCAMERLDRFARARLTLAGNMASPRLAAELALLPGWNRVDFRGKLDRTGVRSVLDSARVGLALFHPVQSYMDSQPVKLFEYMAAGIPVITSDFPRFRDIVEKHRCGLCVSPRDVAGIASAIEFLLANPKEAAAMGQRGRELVLRSFSWETEERTLLKFYVQIAGPPSRGGSRNAAS